MTMVDAPPVGREYDDFLQQKAQSGASCGFAPICLPASLFDFQAALVEWALLKGRAYNPSAIVERILRAYFEAKHNRDKGPG